ncbi:MAG: hypothetical protein KDC66_00845 [Phaeodactylibacter sp.]|nr:hypothetical protein [Phaeodactylibacter sp.]MCB9274709.1 hypothetical protein [Lewinellaceae bacterium]
MMKYSGLPVLLFFLIPVAAAAQYDFSGSWAGKLTQNEGGYTPEYDFELYLVQKGKHITGRSYVKTGRIHAVMELHGEVVDGKWVNLTETRILDNWKYDDMDWCYKTIRLRLFTDGKRQRLEGGWSGTTGSHADCVPGEISLAKQVPRA